VIKPALSAQSNARNQLRDSTNDSIEYGKVISPIIGYCSRKNVFRQPEISFTFQKTSIASPQPSVSHPMGGRVNPRSGAQVLLPADRICVGSGQAE